VSGWGFLDSLRSLGMTIPVIPSGARSAESRNLYFQASRCRSLDSLRSLGMTVGDMRSLGASA